MRHHTDACIDARAATEPVNPSQNLDNTNPITSVTTLPNVATTEIVKPGRLAFLRPSHQHTAASATILLTLAALLSRIIGLVRDIYIAKVFGAGRNTDVYNVAFILPEWINYLLVGGAASITFVTILDRYRARDDEAGGQRALSVILTTMCLVLGAAVLLAEIFTPLFTRIYYDPDSAAGRLCTHITRIVLPAQIFFFAGGVLSAVLLVRKQFSFQAVSPLIYNLGIIAGGLILAHSMGISSLGVGALAGAILGPFAFNAYGAWRVGVRIRPALDFKNPGLREWVRLSLPLMLGVTVITLDNQILAFFARHGSGDISRLLYAKKLFTAPMAILGQAAGAASLPFFASLFGRGQTIAYAAAVNRSVTRLIALSLLGSAGMIALAGPLVDLIFRRGSFNRADATSTALYFGIFALSLALWSSQAIYSRAFYAAGETMTPMLAGTVITVFSLPVYWILHARFGVMGLAWASDAAILLHTGTLAVLLHRRQLVPLFTPRTSNASSRVASDPYPGLDFFELSRALLAALISIAGAIAVLHLLPENATYLSDFRALTVGGLTWALLAALTLHLTGSPLLQQIRRR